MKSSAPSRRSLLKWLATQSLEGLPSGAATDHTVAAYAAALAARDWRLGQCRWIHRANPPGYPHDMAC